MSVRSQNGASVFSRGSLNESGKVKRTSFFHRKIFGIDGIISFFRGKTLRSRRRLSRTPAQFPSGGAGKNFHSKQVFAFFHGKEKQMIGSGDRRFHIAARHRGIDLLAVEMNLHIPVCAEADGNQLIGIRFKFIVEHRRIFVPLVSCAGFQTDVDFVFLESGRNACGDRLHCFLFDAGQLSRNCVKRIDSGIHESEDGPFVRERRLDRLNVTEIVESNLGKCNFTVEFAQIKGKDRGIIGAVALQTGNNFDKHFLFALMQRNPFNETEIFRFAPHPV